MSFGRRHLKTPQERFDDDVNIYPVESRLYHFPDIKYLGGQEFENVYEINRRLDILLKNYNIANDNNKIEKTLVTRETEGGYFFKCKITGCQAFLKFHYTSTGRLMLAKSDIEHQHKMTTRMSKDRLPKIKNSEVEECYDELQLLNFRPGEIVNFIRTRFKISRPHFYAIKYGRNKREIIKNLLMTLSKYDHFFFECKDLQELAAYYRNERLKPVKRQDKDVVIVVSKKMRHFYQRYHGQYVLFSIFPELVLQTKNSQKASYHHVGVLYGQDASGTVNLLFGVVFMRKSIRLAYLYILEKLFNFLGRYPKVLITDYDQHLAQAVRRLQKKTSTQQNSIKFHLQLPNSFIINSFQSRTAPQFLSILSNDLQGLLRESDRNKHQERLRIIMKAIQYNPPASQDRIADQIRKYVKANSLIYLPPLFVGLSMTPYSAANYLRSRVLDFFKSPRPMVLATKAIFEIFQVYPVLKYLSKEQIDARLNPPKECSSKRQKLQLLGLISKTYESTTRMKSVTKSLSQSASLCFHDSLEKCFTGKLQILTTDNRVSYKVVQDAENYPYVIHHVYQMRNKEQVAVWRCNCFYYSKLGLPCWHQIKVCMEQRSSLIPQIHQFWLKESKLNPQRRGMGDVNEHDIKYWSDQTPKICYEQRSKQKIEAAQLKDNRSESNVSNGVYNIKINQNESQYGQDDGYSQKQHEGLNDLINQLNDLNSISIKQNDDYDDNAPDPWSEAFADHPPERKREQNQLYDEAQDPTINFDQHSFRDMLNHGSQLANKKKDKQQKGEQTNKVVLRETNIADKQKFQPQQDYQQQEDNFDNLDLNLDFFDDKQSQSFVSQSSKIGNDAQSNYDLNFSQFNGEANSFSYKTKQGRRSNQNMEIEVIDDDNDGEVPAQNEFNEFDFNDVNSQQDSGEEWERESIEQVNSRPPLGRNRSEVSELEEEGPSDFGFDNDETEKFEPFGKRNFSMCKDDDEE